ncbi:MAG: pyridoxamine 5'-phosphate oxidase [Cyanobacteriota bacterium]|nr:pyridoxamine 5'-phosphate oxidase [Cyanobacteriota bacterium]
MSDSLPPWRALLRGAREREGKRAPQARWLQLATVATDGTPRVRTLVFRGWAGPSELELLTDGRSAKTGELARCQFRLRGRVMVLPPAEADRHREGHWRTLTPTGRALWGWPTPGEPHVAGADFPRSLPDGCPMPDHFLLLRVALRQVELLELLDHPHRRCRWREETGWREEALNP